MSKKVKEKYLIRIMIIEKASQHPIRYVEIESSYSEVLKLGKFLSNKNDKLNLTK